MHKRRWSALSYELRVASYLLKYLLDLRLLVTHSLFLIKPFPVHENGIDICISIDLVSLLSKEISY